MANYFLVGFTNMAVSIDYLPHNGMNRICLFKLSFAFFPRWKSRVDSREVIVFLLLAFGTYTEVRFPDSKALGFDLLAVSPDGRDCIVRVKVLSRTK